MMKSATENDGGRRGVWHAATNGFRRHLPLFAAMGATGALLAPAAMATSTAARSDITMSSDRSAAQRADAVPGYPTQLPPCRPAPAQPRYLIGLTRAQIRALPMSGAGWANVAAQADKRIVVALDDMDSRAASHAFAAALRYVRTGNNSYRAKVVDALEQVRTWNGTFYYSAVNRQMHGWVLAADLVGHRTQAWRDFLSAVRYRTLTGHGRWNSIYRTAHDAANNHGAFARLSHLAIDLFLGDKASRSPFGTPSGVAADVHWARGFLGDRTAYSTQSRDGAAQYGRFGANDWAYSSTWTHESGAWTPINPASAGPAKDGAIPMDVYRERTAFSTTSDGTPIVPAKGVMYSYMTGAAVVSLAALLAANGYYGVWSWSDYAVNRWRRFLARHGYAHPYPSTTGFSDPILNHIYGTSYSAVDAEGYGITGTRWLTHNRNWLKRTPAQCRPRPRR